MPLPTNPEDRRIKTNTPMAMGKLLKTWATGRNYVDNAQFPIPKPDTKYPPPKSFPEFVDQCLTAGVNLFYDDKDGTSVERTDGMGLLVVQGDTNVLVVRLSPAAFIDKSEKQLIATPDKYEMTPHYTDILNSVTIKPGKIDNELHRLETHASSIGDYTIRTCF